MPSNYFMKLLMVRSGGLGDVLMLTAVAHAFKQGPNPPHITFYTDFPQVLKDNPDVDAVNDMSSSSFDRTIDFNWSVEGPAINPASKCSEEDYMTKPRLDIFFRHAGIDMPPSPRLYFYLNEEDRCYVKQVVAEPYIVYSLHATSMLRSYPIEFSLEVIKQLSKVCQVVTVGQSRSMRDYKQLSQACEANRNIIDMTDKTSIRHAAALIGHAECLITPDTGLLHMANAVNTPCVAIFGNIDPQLRVSYYHNTTPIYKNIWCASGCGDRYFYVQQNCPSWGEISKNSMGAACMRAISPDEIVDVTMKVAGLYPKDKKTSLTLL